MKLTGDQFEHLKRALLSAFPSHASLTEMVRVRLEETLTTIAGGNDLSEIAFSLILWAETKGRIEELVTKAHQHNPGNQQLCAFLEQFSKRTVNFIEVNNAVISEFSENTNKVEIKLPFVVMAMKEHEAKNLFDETFFQTHSKEKISFQKIKETLQDRTLSSLYGSERDAWNPFLCGERGIKSHIIHVTNFFNELCNEHLLNIAPHNHPYADVADLSLVKPLFFSEDFFDKSKVFELSKMLKKEYGGCILIVDPLSLFYTELTKILLQYQKTIKMMIILSPLCSQTEQINTSISQKIKEELPEAYQSLYVYFEPSYGFIAEEKEAFQRWVYLLLPAIIKKQLQRIKKDNEKTLEERTGSKRAGFGGLVTEFRGL